MKDKHPFFYFGIPEKIARSPETPRSFSKVYLISIIALVVVFPFACFLAEPARVPQGAGSFLLFGKWFIFWAVGLRLLVAGLRQVFNPAFTAREIFHIMDKTSYDIVRELGFANICFGAVGVVSLFIPSWRLVSAVASGLYYGLAAMNHLIKKPVGINEAIALYSDILIFGVLLAYIFSVAL